MQPLDFAFRYGMYDKEYLEMVPVSSKRNNIIIQVIYMSLRDYKNTGLSLPATTIEWALYQIPEQVSA